MNCIRHRAQRCGVKEDRSRQTGAWRSTRPPVQLFQYVVREEKCRTGHDSRTEHRSLRHDPQDARCLQVDLPWSIQVGSGLGRERYVNVALNAITRSPSMARLGVKRYNRQAKWPAKDKPPLVLERVRFDLF